MAVTGMALERITRERTEIPPRFRLPERVVYFLDPNSRRLVMISNRETFEGQKTLDKFGLFAEIVELDAEGKPHYYLTNSEVIAEMDSYQLVQVGPNKYRLPPSHIDVVEEGELEREKRFVAWNSWIANLQAWMNEAAIDPSEDLETFLTRHHELKAKSEREIRSRIDSSFPEGQQGFDENVVPVNLILSVPENRELLGRASQAAGLFPVFVDLRDLVDYRAEMADAVTKMRTAEEKYLLGLWLPQTASLTLGSRDLPAIITCDFSARDKLGDYQRRSESEYPLDASIVLNQVREVQKNNSIFSVVDVWLDPRERVAMERGARTLWNRF